MKSLKTGIDYVLCLVGASVGYENLEHAKEVCESAVTASDLKDFIKVAITAAVPLIVKEAVVYSKKGIAAIKARKNTNVS